MRTPSGRCHLCPQGPGMPPSCACPAPTGPRSSAFPPTAAASGLGAQPGGDEGQSAPLHVFVDAYEHSSALAGLPPRGSWRGVPGCPLSVSATCVCTDRPAACPRPCVLTLPALPPPLVHCRLPASPHVHVTTAVHLLGALDRSRAERRGPRPEGLGHVTDVSATQCGYRGDGTQLLRMSLCHGAGRAVASSEGDA